MFVCVCAHEMFECEAQRWLMDFYDCTYLLTNAVKRHHLHFLRRIVVDHYCCMHRYCMHRCCRFHRGWAMLHFLANLQLLAVVEWLAHHNLRLGALRNEVIDDRILAWLGNVANADSHLDIANNDCMIFLVERFRWHHRCIELERPGRKREKIKITHRISN